MDQLLHSLLIPHDGSLVPAYALSASATTALADLTEPRRNIPCLTVGSAGTESLSKSPSLPRMEEQQDPMAGRTGHEHMPAKSPPITRQYGNAVPLADWVLENPYDRKLCPIQPDPRSNGEYSWRFHEICYHKGLAPSFTYDEVANGCFTVKVQVGSHCIEAPELYPSKKQAKEAVCKLAVADLPLLDLELDDNNKRKSSGIHDDSAQECFPARKDSITFVEDENWVGILIEHAQQKRVSLPEYEEKQTAHKPPRFIVTVRIHGGPTTPFGAGFSPARTKKAAKSAAAQEAVLWLRSEGRLPETPPAKRQKTALGPSLGVHSQTVDLGATLNADDASSTTSMSIAQRVHELSSSLGFSQPRFNTWATSLPPDASTHAGPSFVSTAAYYSNADSNVEPRLAGPVGQVDWVFGKKKAKELCCQGVLKVLESIEQSRLT